MRLLFSQKTSRNVESDTRVSSTLLNKLLSLKAHHRNSMILWKVEDLVLKSIENVALDLRRQY